MPRSRERPPAPPQLPIPWVRMWGVWTDEERRDAVIRQRGWPEDTTDDDKQLYADQVVAGLQGLYEQLDELSDEELAKLREEHWHSLNTAIRRARLAEEHRKRRIAERNVEFMYLRMLGEKQAKIARAAGVTPKVVSDAIGTTIDPHGPSGRYQRDGTE